VPRPEEHIQRAAFNFPTVSFLGFGSDPVTVLAIEVFLGDRRRFGDGRTVASYIGMIPSEHSSGHRQRLGAMSKEGNSLVRCLWCEATLRVVRRDPELKRYYRRKLVQKGMGKARIAAARKLGIRLRIIMRDQIGYQEFCRRGESRSLDLWIEAFNLLNHAQFYGHASVDGEVNDPNVGRVVSADPRLPRLIQLSVASSISDIGEPVNFKRPVAAAPLRSSLQWPR
jgi:Transposase IS116/IS110/IS902 family